MRNPRTNPRDYGANDLTYHRKVYYAALAIYAVMSGLFVIGCAVLIDYRAIFQSGIIGYLHVITGILIGVFIPSNTIEEGSVAVVRHEREQQQRRQEIAVFQKAATSLMVVAVIGIAFSSFYLYNLSYILIGICPGLSSDDSIVNPTMVTLELTYRHKPLNEYYAKKNIVKLRYNMTSQSIIRKTKHFNPNVADYDRWISQHDIHSFSESNMAGSAPLAPFCINRTDSLLFSFLENEISHLVYTNLKERQDSRSIRITDKYRRMTLSDEVEDEMDIDHLTQKICRHEYAVVILIICFLLLWDLISACLIAYCIYIRHQPILY